MNENQNPTQLTIGPSNGNESRIIFSALENLDRNPNRFTESRLRALLAFAFLPSVNGLPIPPEIAEYATNVLHKHMEHLGINLPNNGAITLAEQIEQVITASNVQRDPPLQESFALLDS